MGRVRGLLIEIIFAADVDQIGHVDQADLPTNHQNPFAPRFIEN
jgi:hypothetical protein